MRHHCTLTLLAIGLFCGLRADARSDDWQDVSAELIAAQRPGYGVLTGVAVHPASGDVFAFLSEKGLYRSSDNGGTWARYGEPITGRTEWPGAMQLFTEEKADRWLVATVYGGPIVAGEDGRSAWRAMDRAASHVDWCAVAPDDPQYTFVLALKHESGDVLLCSNDGGKSFREVGKDFGPACVFDSQTAVVLHGPAGKRRAMRTTDGGKSFESCTDWNTRALPQWREGSPYWLVDGAIVTSSDKGNTWQQWCKVEGGLFGPVFGTSLQHLFVISRTGILESRDSGATWLPPLALPNAFDARSPLTWLAFDPPRKTLYAAQMGGHLFRRTVE